MSSIPVLAAQDSTYDSNCFKCGGLSTIYDVVDRWSEYPVEIRDCEHGYEGESDFLKVYYERVRYCCSDCDVCWEQTEFLGMEWFCGH